MQSLARGPAHLISSPPRHRMQLKASRGQCRRGGGGPHRSQRLVRSYGLVRLGSFLSSPASRSPAAAHHHATERHSSSGARGGKYGAAPALGDRGGGRGRGSERRAGAAPSRPRPRRTWPSWLITRGGPGGQRARAPGAQASTWSVRVAGHGAVATWPLHDWRVAIRRFRSGVAAAAAMLGCARHAAT